MDIQPLIESQYFHIYNRGVNSEELFKQEIIIDKIYGCYS
jgi:hypothetical protein